MSRALAEVPCTRRLAASGATVRSKVPVITGDSPQHPTIGATVAEQSRLDKVIALARHRGFVFQAGEIYGGSRSAWDYGPLGTELKENIRRQWWQTFVRGRGDMVGLDSSIILPKRVWEASGHVATFTDPLVECLSCHKRFRADNLVEDFEARKGRAAENGLA